VADLNKDGKLDIAVAGKTGTYVLLNEGLKSRGGTDWAVSLMPWVPGVCRRLDLLCVQGALQVNVKKG